MAIPQEEFTLGVEEEYQIIDPNTRELSSSALSILPKAEQTLGEQVQPELRLSQIEIATPVCHTLAEVRSELQRLRREVIAAAKQNGQQIAAAGTHPFSHWKVQKITPKKRYRGLAEHYQHIAQETTICGCHVHIGIRDREIALQVMNRTRPWLAALLALSASSPFWLGEDSGYASYRTEVWSQWPMSGPPLIFESLEEYKQLVQTLVAIGMIANTTNIYWDMRISERYETVEIRVADVCSTIDEAVMLAGLVRAIVRTCYEQAKANQPFTTIRPELLRIAHWHAARHGLSENLIDVEEQRAIPAKDLIEKLLNGARPALEAEGDWEEVSTLARRTVQQGNCASRQREIYQRTKRMEDVVDLLVTETARGTDE